MSMCAAPGTGGAFLADMLGAIDCQAQTIGMGGYQALASPSSPTALAMAALLTIFVGLFGLRMLLGHAPSVSESIIAIVKVGVVLTLASSWAAYRVIAYDVVLQGPAELFGSIGSGAGLPGAAGGLTARLQGADTGIVALTLAGSGRLDIASVPQAGSTTADAAPMVVADGFALGTARVAYLGSTIAALGIVRLGAGLLLALAPMFAGFLLFDATRFLFMGWLRMLAAFALGALAVTVVLSVELAILEPWLAQVLALRTARVATIAAPVELLVITLAFAIVLFALIVMAARIAWASVMPTLARPQIVIRDATQGLRGLAIGQPDNERSPMLIASRPVAIADAVATAQRREGGSGGWRSVSVARLADAATTGPSTLRTPSGATPLGQSYRRTAQRSSTASVARNART
jgi:type IV secretion system protein VirB6